MLLYTSIELSYPQKLPNPAIFPFYVNPPAIGRFILIMEQLIAKLKKSIRYRMYRKKRHFSQKEAAGKLGLKSPAELSRWESGTLTPRLINICKLLLLYDVSFEELFHDFLEVVREEYPELTENPHVASSTNIYE